MKPPVIVIGAGRSGTNALRDALCAAPEFHTWPCDEINYIWRTGNRDFPTDELRPEHARPAVRSKIHAAFDRRAKRVPHARVVEKTCANTLRVGFVSQVFPDAQLVHLVRDGRAVVASAIQRWTAPLDIPYLTRKARFVPPLDLPHYASRYLRSHLSRLRSDEDRLSWWGPRFEGMDTFDTSTPVVELAARQWVACVTAAQVQLAQLPPERVHTVVYRDLVTDPVTVLRNVLAFLGAETNSDAVRDAASTIHSGSLDSWQRTLDHEQKLIVSGIVDDLNATLGFED